MNDWRETRIRLSPQDHERLRVAAAHAGMSMMAFVRQAALDAIARTEQAQITKRHDHA